MYPVVCKKIKNYYKSVLMTYILTQYSLLFSSIVSGVCCVDNCCQTMTIFILISWKIFCWFLPQWMHVKVWIMYDGGETFVLGAMMTYVWTLNSNYYKSFCLQKPAKQKCCELPILWKDEKKREFLRRVCIIISGLEKIKKFSVNDLSSRCIVL